MSKPLPTYAEYCAEVHRDQQRWDQVERQIQAGIALNWTGPRTGRPEEPTGEAYTQFIYWRGRRDGIADYREEQERRERDRREWKTKRIEIEKALDATGYDYDDILRALGVEGLY